MLHPGAENPFQCWMNVSEQTAEPVGGLIDLLGQVVVKSGQHRQLGGLFVVAAQWPQCVRH